MTDTEEVVMRGRPKDETLTPRILEAARGELADSGIDGFSVRQVAVRAGVSRNAISARWSSTEALLHDVLGELAALSFEPSGDLRADLLELGEKFVAGLASGALDIQLRVAADAARHPETYGRVQERVLLPMSDALVTAFRAAQESGQVRDGDVAWLVRAFVGAILARTFQRPQRAPATPEDLRQLVDEVCRWVRP